MEQENILTTVEGISAFAQLKSFIREKQKINTTYEEPIGQDI